MTYRKFLARALTVAALSMLGNPAQSAVLIDFSEVGADLVVSVSGTLDITGLTHLAYGGSSTGASSINSGASQDYLIFGASAAPIERYDFINTRIPVFAGTFSATADFTTGDSFYFWNSNTNSARLFLEDSFVSGSALNATMTFLNTTLVDIGGINTGTITLANDTIEFTVNANTGGASVPAPLSVALFGIGLAALRRARHAT
ncbi:MAG: hypothetical protein H6926_07045 [Chromatiales bacterium]|nr:hypothetical protein [Gammaproteobacteria bacterium]MCP5352926.1 hypothetical protein [Chromatiales bacterium]